MTISINLIIIILISLTALKVSYLFYRLGWPTTDAGHLRRIINELFTHIGYLVLGLIGFIVFWAKSVSLLVGSAVFLLGLLLLFGGYPLYLRLQYQWEQRQTLKP